MITTSDDFVADVLDACLWPPADGDAPLTFAKILRVADREIVGHIIPLVVASHGDYYTQNIKYNIIANKAPYKLPKDLFGPVRDVTWIDASDATNERSIPMIDLDDLGHTDKLPPSACGFYHYIDGDFVKLWPVPDSTVDQIRIRYIRHPSRLCLLAAATTITTATFTAGFPVALGIVADNGPWSLGTYVDVISRYNSHQVLIDEGFSSGVTTLVLSLSRYDLTNPQVNEELGGATGGTVNNGNWECAGDYVATHGYTPILPIPDHFVPTLVSRVASACLRLHGDDDRAELEAKDALSKTSMATAITKPRSLAEPRIQVPRNSHLRTNFRGFR